MKRQTFITKIRKLGFTLRRDTVRPDRRTYHSLTGKCWWTVYTDHAKLHTSWDTVEAEEIFDHVTERE